jgi:NSS family neurotransmitter:Na+ symporter
VAAKPETFSTRWTMMLAMLGMAVGTGNIWRFPRIVAQNGGGEFLVPWIVFLFMWSIPLIMVEFGLGRKTRSGPAAAFLAALGPRWAWMGAWVAFVATAIMFYYSVVTGWTLRYIWAALAGQVPGREPGTFWAQYTTSWWPVLTHGLSMALGVWVVARGVTAIERVAKVLMPTLIVLVVVLAIRAVTLPGAGAGLHYLFHVDWHRMGNASLWVQALTQNAWDTGAGWGLVLCYAAYLRQREDTTLNAVMLPAANNMVSLLSGIMVLCTVFAVVPELAANLAAQPQGLSAYPQLAEAVRAGQPLTGNLIQQTIFGAGNEGLTFIWMPQLFARVPFGRLFMLLFFVALAFAAFTSLVSMLELATRVLLDAGLQRARAIRWVGAVGFLLGLPSALSLGVLHNQDWVWGVGLMLSGLFFAIAVIGSGVRQFRQEQLNHPDSDLHVGRWWDVLIAVVVPLEAIILLVWWLVQASGPAGWLSPFGVDNVGTILLQWGVVILVLLAINRWLVARMRRTRASAELPRP